MLRMFGGLGIKLSKNKIQNKISLQLLFVVFLSFIIAFTVSVLFLHYILIYYMLNYKNIRPEIYNSITLMVFIIGILIFVLTFFLLINRKVKYIKYIANQVNKIANEDFGSLIEVRGNDEIAELCRNINFLSKELKRKFDHEKEIEKSKSELISGVSHDLRTPLTAIKGYLLLIKDKQYKTPEELENFIDVAFNKTEMLESLIENLFDYTRFSCKEVNMNLQRLCLNDIVEQVVMDYGSIFEKEHLKLHLSIPDIKYCVQIDADKFVRVIENLLGNALKYSLKPGDVWVNLSSDNQGVKMTIKNKGESLDQESLVHLFDRFYRLEKSRSNETGGAGLGLAIAKSIVELHNGKIWAESQGEIIIFNVWLPVS